MDEEGGHRQYDDTTTARIAPRSSRKLHIVLASIVVVGLICSVGFGVGFSRDGSDSKTEKAENETAKPVATTPVVDTAAKDDSTTATTTISSAADTETVPSTSSVGFTNSLAAISPQSIQESYGSCDALIPDLKAAARMMGNSYIESTAKMYYAEGGYFDMMRESMAPMAETTTVITTMSATKSASKSTTSNNPHGTNNQHDGVEEADMTQSNGVDVFIVYGNEIVVVNAATMKETNRTTIPQDEGAGSECYGGYVRGMLLVEDSLVVFVETSCSVEYESTSADSYMYSTSVYKTKILIYDAKTMKLKTNEELSGTYLSSRAIGTNVMVATSTYFDTYMLTSYLDPYVFEDFSSTTQLDEAGYRKKAQAALELNLDSFVESMVSTMDCTNMQKLSLFQNTNETIANITYNGFAYVSSFSATAATFNKSTTSMFVPSSYMRVYASNDTMVLSCDGAWMDPMSFESIPETYIITFELEGSVIKPGKLGKVPGTVMGSSGLDHVKKNGKDYIRVASTTSMWNTDIDAMTGDDFGFMSQPDTTSQVTILEVTQGSDGYMPVVGEITGLGKPSESIYSVLFHGDRGYVTTYNYTDPFYTLDLSDPTNPVKVGELEIPGFSTYLYAVSDNLVLGVGRSTDQDDVAVNFQLSLFDVSDFSQPKRVQMWEEKASGNKTVSATTYSDAEFESKAFRYHFETKTLIIPMTMYEYTKTPCTDYETSSFVDDFIADDDAFGGNATSVSMSSSQSMSSDGDIMTVTTTSSSDGTTSECYYETPTGNSFDGFKLYKIDAANGISADFSIEHVTGDFESGGCYGYGYLTPRSMIFGNDIVTMKGHTVLSYDMTTKTKAATLDLDAGITDCSGSYYYGI